MANFLGKLKHIIGGSPQDYQYYEQEMAEMTEQNSPEMYEEIMPVAEEEQPEPKPQPKTSARRRHRDKSHFQMDMPSDSMMDSSPLSKKLPDNVIGMPGVSHSMNEVVVIEPHSFDEIPQVIQTLREQRCVVLNLNVMDPEEAQRAVDFVAGGTYAIDGHQERIGESIFLFTPRSVKVSTITGNGYQLSEPLATSGMGPNPLSDLSDSLWDEPNTKLAQ